MSDELPLVLIRKIVSREELEKLYPIKYEMHADGVKEIKCDFCKESCNNDWCPTKDEE